MTRVNAGRPIERGVNECCTRASFKEEAQIQDISNPRKA